MQTSLSAGDEHKHRGGPWWRDVATLVAVVGLLVTMIVNTFGIWEQVDQSKLAHEQAVRAADEAVQARIDTKLGLVTQLNALATDADRDVVAAGVEEARCDLAHDWTPRQRAVIARAAQYYDYLAWVFTQRATLLPSARAYARPAMFDTYALAREVFTARSIKLYYSHLRSYVLHTPGSAPPDPCA